MLFSRWSNGVGFIACLVGVCFCGIPIVGQHPRKSGQASGTGAASTPQATLAPKAVKSRSQRSEVKNERRAQDTNVSVRAWKLLKAGLGEKDVAKRTEAASALAIVGQRPKAVSLLETALTDKDPPVRQTAVLALGEMKARRSIPKLRAMLEDDAPEVSFAAAQALWRMGDRSGRAVLLEVLAGERKSSGGGLGRKIGEMKKTLHNPSALAKIGITQGAAAFFGPAAIGLKVAEELRKDNSAAGRAASAALLATDMNPESADQLEQALDDKNWLVRASAAKALAKRKDRHALPQLEALLSDDKDVVRYSAAAAILALR